MCALTTNQWTRYIYLLINSLSKQPKYSFTICLLNGTYLNTSYLVANSFLFEKLMLFLMLAPAKYKSVGTLLDLPNKKLAML